MIEQLSLNRTPTCVPGRGERRDARRLDDGLTQVRTGTRVLRQDDPSKKKRHISAPAPRMDSTEVNTTLSPR